MSANSIATYPINPTAYSLGGARFNSVKLHGAGHSISVIAEAGIHNPEPIELEDVDQWLYGSTDEAASLVRAPPGEVFEAAPET